MYSEGDLWIDLSLKGHVVACVLVQVGYVIRSFIQWYLFMNMHKIIQDIVRKNIFC